jgi:hypothetical protein
VEKCGKAGQATDDSITRCMCFACWITKATDTHSKYVILIAFPWQQWLCKHASVLHCVYIACHSAVTLSLAVPAGLVSHKYKLKGHAESQIHCHITHV